MRFWIALLDVDGFLVFGNRGIGITAIRQQNGIAVVSFGVAWIQAKCFAIVGFRRNRVAFLFELNRALELLQGSWVARLRARLLGERHCDKGRNNEYSSCSPVHIYTIPFRHT